MSDTLSTATIGPHALLTPKNSVLVVIGHQPFQFANLHSQTVANRMLIEFLR